jgi:L-threonylcarbamoyladenylate synthase
LKTEIVCIEDSEFHEDALSRAAEIITAGGLVVFPTETVYGLGGNALDADAAMKIYAAKGRPSDNPLIIHLADPKDAERYAETSEAYYRLAKAFMPGPLTVILPKKDSIPLSVTGGLSTVAVRCPAHPVAQALIRKAGVAIAAPSANLSGKPSPTSALHVIHDLSGRVNMIIDGGDCEIGLESTIVSLDGNHATLLRPGAVTRDALACVLEEVTVSDAVERKLKMNERPLSPGMKYRHYAPDAPLVLLTGDEERIIDFLRLEQQKEGGCVILAYDEEISRLSPEGLLPVGQRNDLARQAQALFSRLREADAYHPRIVYAHLPPKDGLGLALYNRMIRAAAHTIMEIR